MSLTFIKLDINILNDTKIKLIRKMPDGDSLLVLWIGILCLAMKSGSPGILEIGRDIPFTDDALAVDLDIPINTVRLGLSIFERYRMIEIMEDGSIFIVNFDKHQEVSKIKENSEKSRIRSARYREKIKMIAAEDDSASRERSRDECVRHADSECDVTSRHALDKDKDKDEDKDKDIYPSSGVIDSGHPDTDPPLVNSPELTDTPNVDGCEKQKSRYPDGFLKFWDAYPKKVGKEAAFKAYKNIKAPRPSMGVILKSISDHMSTRQWADKSFIPNPSTYLNQRRWEDEFGSDDLQKQPKGGLQSDFSKVEYTGTDLSGIDWIPDDVKNM